MPIFFHHAGFSRCGGGILQIFQNLVSGGIRSAAFLDGLRYRSDDAAGGVFDFPHGFDEIFLSGGGAADG